jgi:FkbM family methyltransferase
MTIAEALYTVVLKPKPLKKLANQVIKWTIPTRLERHGATVVLNPHDPVVSGALTLGVYERPETRFFCRACRENMVFLDVGANVGYYTALAMRRVGERGQVIALEPDPQSFHYLKQTVAANGGRNVVCLQKAAALESGTLKLYLSSDNHGDNRLYWNELCDTSCDVEVAPVDSILSDSGVGSVDLVKMDVQGFEGQVLAGMRETIRRARNLIILSEFWPHGLRSAGTDPKALLAGLEAQGLRLYELMHDGGLAKLEDHNKLIETYRGRKYTNIVAVKGTMPKSLAVR